MNCEHIEQDLDELALLDASEHSADVEQHLQQCATCRAKLDERREAWTLMVDVAEAIPVSLTLQENLFGRVEADAPSPSDTNWTTAAWARYAFAASILAITTLGVYVLRYRSPAPDDSAMKSVATQLKRLEEIRDEFGNPGVVYVALKDENRPSAGAYIVLDPIANELHFFALHLTKPADNTQYRLWLLRDEKVVASGTLAFNPQQLATAILELGDRRDDIEVLVTRQRDATTSRPAGQPYFRTALRLGELKRPVPGR